MAAQPSRDWREVPIANEDGLYQQHRVTMKAVQAAKSAKFGKGRALHRKPILALPGTFTVLDNLPEHARQGVFAKPGSHEALIRLSNGGTNVQSDNKPDVRGFAIKVMGVEGPSALGNGNTQCQDFLLINHSKFSFSDPNEFVGIVESASKGGLAPVFYMIKRHGLLGGLRTLKELGANFAKPFSGFASEMLYSAAPIACGPYACRVRMLPPDTPSGVHSKDVNWADEFLTHLAKRELNFDIQLQFFVNESQTPIEDASVDWSEAVAPYLTVARLTIAQSALDKCKDPAFVKKVEDEAFDPWCALADHRPLGRIMRLRKAVYFDSVQARK